MITVIRGIKVYAPEYLGVKDIVITGDKIEGLYDNLEIPYNFINIDIIDGKNKILFPGFIDSHVHILGGGGEGGFSTRIGEIDVDTIIGAGVTTVVGCLGTDSICRNMKTLLAKANGLEEDGITTYCYTGGYDIPVKTVLEGVKEDIMLIDKIIGVGEIALSDHRSSQPTFEEFIRVAADSRVGGLLSGKAGIVDIHLGDGKKKLEYLNRMIDETEIPASQLLPTHINRSRDLLKEGEKYAKKGGFIDLTTSSDPKHLEPDEVTASEGLAILLNNGVDISQILFSSDGNGSMPIFDRGGELSGVGVCRIESIYDEVKEAIISHRVSIEDAIRTITANPAKLLKLKNKGEITPGSDADLVIVDEKTLKITNVIAKGKIKK